MIRRYYINGQGYNPIDGSNTYIKKYGSIKSKAMVGRRE